MNFYLYIIKSYLIIIFSFINYESYNYINVFKLRKNGQTIHRPKTGKGILRVVAESCRFKLIVGFIFTFLKTISKNIFTLKFVLNN